MINREKPDISSGFLFPLPHFVLSLFKTGQVK